MNRLFKLFTLFVWSSAVAQSNVDSMLAKRESSNENDLGLFPVQNFTHQETGGHHQNWTITQDKNGFIYSGNGKGILEYDGIAWRLISSPGLHAVRSVVVDKNNVKWIGADRELGYLESDSLGFLQFKSLKDKIPSSHPLTGNVWQIITDHDRILFVTENAIYSWRDDRFRVIPRQGEIHRSNQVNGVFYFRIADKGMYSLNGDILEPIPDREKFQHLRIDAVMPYQTTAVLFASREGGLYVFDGKHVNKFENDVDDYLIKNNLYAGIMLSDSSYAFATLRGGIIIMDKNGKRRKVITTNEGILNNQVYGIVEDNRNSLWLALQTGISQVEWCLPYTFYDRKLGVEGTSSTLTRHNGKLYVGTYDGLFRQEKISGSGPVKFKRVDGIQNGCFSLLSLGKDLLAGSANGLFLISNGGVVQLKKLTACRTLWRWRKDPDRIFVGHRGGLSAFYLKRGKWFHEMDFDQVDGEIRSIVEDEKGGLWLGTTLNKIIKLEFPEWNHSSIQSNWGGIKVNYYDDQHGLPKETNSIYLIDGELLVYTFGENGSLFKLNENSGKFSKTTDFGKKFGLDSLTIHPVAYQNDGDYILLGSASRSGKSYHFSAARISPSGTYKVTRIYDDRFRSTTENPVYWDQNDLLWFGGEQITRYDINTPLDITPPSGTYIRKVTRGQDARIYGGDKATFLEPKLDYSSDGLRFEFATPGFTGKENNKFQYQLVGFDSKWSDWTGESKKDYTNLPEGDYQFVVRSQNVYGEMSTADVFHFEILAPWYRTSWAYFFYSVLFAGFLFLSLQLRARKLESEKKALGLIVAARTEEIRAQANQLKSQAEKLQELDQAKSRFFANISHEFRTPLTLIAGCLEDLTKDVNEKENEARISIMQKNTERLRQLIEQLLDLSRLESGKLKLIVAPINPFHFLRAITSSFSSWAAQKEITLTVDLPNQSVEGYLDEDVLEKIINNLLSNAIKFTPQQGSVYLSAQCDEKKLTVYVKDNGPGIPDSKINQIFERFYQIDDSNTRSQEGSGIGLALVKELVSLHHGEISVQSVPERGTSFKITIPIDEKNYSSEQKEVVQKNRTTKEIVKRKEIARVDANEDFSDTSLDRPLILVVEDNVDLGRYIGDHLPDSGIILAVNGKDGLAKAIHHIPDLIISDVMMPEMDGVELCNHIKEEEKTSHIPVILLTAKADLESRLEGLETGADDYMTKPFDARELQTRVRNLIAQRAKLREQFSRTMVLKPKDIAITPPDEIFLNKVMAIIENHLGDSEFSVDHFQKEIGMSRMQLHRKLKALTGHSAGEFLRIQRLIRASQLFNMGIDNVTDVCYQTGFTSLSYFAKCFKRQFGVSPKDYASLHSQTS